VPALPAAKPSRAPAPTNIATAAMRARLQTTAETAAHGSLAHDAMRELRNMVALRG
jgi:hypothetical protein